MRQETHPYDGHYIVAQFPQTTFPKDEQYDQKKLSVKCENMTIRAEIYAHQSPNKLNQHWRRNPKPIVDVPLISSPAWIHNFVILTRSSQLYLQNMLLDI